jgi:plasmid stability protein
VPTLTIKNIPDDVYRRLKQQAETNRRSLNREVIACLEQTVFSQAIDPEQILASARSIREKTRQYQIGKEEFNQVKNDGRP